MENLLQQRYNCMLLLVWLQGILTVLETTGEYFEKRTFWFWPSKPSFFFSVLLPNYQTAKTHLSYQVHFVFVQTSLFSPSAHHALVSVVR